MEFDWKKVRSVSGMGPGYDRGIHRMVEAGIAYLETADLKGTRSTADGLEAAMMKACPDCLGAAYGCSASIVKFLRENGWDAFERANRRQ